MAKTKLLMTGNEAMAEGAIQAGCTFYAGYPITPQNEIPAYMARHMSHAKGVFIQAESELAAINMVFGASAAGVRAMTSSSGPGISLKQEGISYIAGAELPAVIVNIMRGGPGLGNIAPSQSDYFQATRGGGHGDYHSVVLAPSCVQEAYQLMFLAFDLADKYRVPVIILGDGILGQMMEPVTADYADKKPQITQIKKPWALTGCIGRKANIIKSFYLKEGDLEKFNLRLQKKYQTIQQKEQRWKDMFLNDAKIILVAYGTLARIARCVVNRLRGKGKEIGLIQPITLWPFPKKAFTRYSLLATRPVRNLAPGDSKKGISNGVRYLVIEMSYGQMLEDVRLAVNGKIPVEFLGRAGGGVPTEEEIIKKTVKLLNC